MMSRMDRRIRKWIVKLFPGRYPTLYSTLDDPMIVPAQEAAYRLGYETYLRLGDRVLDVGFGLGYGLRLMAQKAETLAGIEIDRRVVRYAHRLIQEVPGIQAIQHYDGMHIPFPDDEFDLVACIDVIEHVPGYLHLLREMVRVSRSVVLVSTPNRRPEYTLPNGRPRNPWHLREWSDDEFNAILEQIPGIRVEWHYLNGPWEGPFWISSELTTDTMTLTPALIKLDERRIPAYQTGVPLSNTRS